MIKFSLYIPSLELSATGNVHDIAQKIANNCNPFIDKQSLITDIMSASTIIVTTQGKACVVKRLK
ncbi:MAG: hypothetical protein GY823_04080 [Flavobacteriaceae bacterium]|nr:hypothetical protein [Flavobacteriaceae bacterium]